MQEEYWDKLINGHFDNSLSSEEHTEFESLIIQSESARTRFWELSEIHGMTRDATFLAWEEEYDTDDHEPKSFPSSLQQKTKSVKQEIKSSVQPFWPKSAVMLLFGLLAGVLSTSIAWAISTPKLNVPLVLLLESFETDEQPTVTGATLETDLWSGDFTRLSKGQKNVTPVSGEKMLQFLSGDYEGKPNPGGYIGDVYRLIDVRDQQDRFMDSRSVMQISAKFNTYRFPTNQEFQYSISLYALDQETAANTITLSNTNMEELSLATSQRSRDVLDRDPKTWQEGIVELRLPSETDYVLIRLAIAHSGKNRGSDPYSFEGQFLDDVHVSLIESPLQNLTVGE